MAKETYRERMRRLEEELHKAFSDRDAKRYFILCDELGYTPTEDYEQELYSRGQLEHDVDQEYAEDLESIVDPIEASIPENVRNFFDFAERIPLDDTSVSGLKKKRDALVSCFGKFGKGGSDDLSRVDINDVREGFNVHVRYKRILESYMEKYFK